MIHKGNYGEVVTGDIPAGIGLPFTKNDSRRELNTIESTARTIRRVQDGKLTEEDLQVCLTKNSGNIGYTPEQLEAAAKDFLQQQDGAEPLQEPNSESDLPQR